MKVQQSPFFVRKVKKFHGGQKAILDLQIQQLLLNPDLGEDKKGDLKGVFVHKFKMSNEQYLLSYRFSEDSLELISIGNHENYYRELKSYLKSK